MSGSGSLASDTSDVYAHLVAPKVVRSIFDARATATVTNTGRTDAALNNMTLGSPVLALSLFNSKGLPMATVPPPAPPADMSRYDFKLRPGASRSFSYELAAMFDKELTAGTYVLRMRGIHSDNVLLTIGKTSSPGKKKTTKKRTVRAVINKQF